MRILMLAQFYPPTMGGEEQHVRTLSRALVQRGHEVSVVTLWSKDLPEFDLDEGVQVYRVRSTMQRAGWLFKESGRRHAPPFPDPEAVAALRKIIARERPQIVHGHNWFLHSFLPLKAWSGARLVVTLHDYSLVCAKKRLMYRGAPCSGPGFKCLGCSIEHYGPAKGLMTVTGNALSSRVERREVDLFLAVSQATAAGNGLIGSGLPYQVIPNFILDEPEPDGARQPNPLDALADQEYLLFVGDVVPDKGVNVLLQAYAGLADVPPLVLIGRLDSSSPRAAPGNVRFMNALPHSLVIQAWRRSLLGLLPSLVPETFGLAVLEAMAQGRPVIASRIGGLTDVVADGESGLLVPPGDVAALQEAMRRLIGDVPLRQRMGAAARQRADEFRASRIVPRIEEAYARLLEPTAGRVGKPEDGGIWNGAS